MRGAHTIPCARPPEKTQKVTGVQDVTRTLFAGPKWNVCLNAVGEPMGGIRARAAADAFVSLRPSFAPAAEAASETVRPCLILKDGEGEGDRDGTGGGGSRRFSEPVTLLSLAPTSDREGIRRRARDALRCGVVEVEGSEVDAGVNGTREPDARGEPGPSCAASCGAEHRRESMTC